jgi:hypothetical protein
VAAFGCPTTPPSEAYPKRDAGGRILIDVPLEVVLYELTLK